MTRFSFRARLCAITTLAGAAIRYEIYGFDKDGRKAEVYFHPVTGAIVEAK